MEHKNSLKKLGKSTDNKELQKGEGFQLWLYGRLLEGQSKIHLCKLYAGVALESQLELTKEAIVPEKKIAKIFQTKTLGQKGEIDSRFKNIRQTPLSALPIDEEILKAREAITHE